MFRGLNLENLLVLQQYHRHTLRLTPLSRAGPAERETVSLTSIVKVHLAASSVPAHHGASVMGR